MRRPAAGFVDLWVAAARPAITEIVLSRYLGKIPEIDRGEYGKPALRTGELEFNVSRAGGLAAIAVSTGYAIGLDIERAGRWPEPVAFARRYLAPEEADAVEALPAEERRAELTRLWTAKEAYVKALGTGLTATAPRSFVVDGTSVVSTHDGAPGSGWSLTALRLPPGYWGTVALRGPLSGLRVLAG
jgi:4'-phosphopantetheinyl transferase